MPRMFFVVLAVALILAVVSVASGNLIAAGGGAILLLGGIIYGYLYNKGGNRADIDRAEQGAVELREQLNREDNP